MSPIELVIERANIAAAKQTAAAAMLLKYTQLVTKMAEVLGAEYFAMADAQSSVSWNVPVDNLTDIGPRLEALDALGVPLEAWRSYDHHDGRTFYCWRCFPELLISITAVPMADGSCQVVQVGTTKSTEHEMVQVTKEVPVYQVLCKE